jgi:rod shape-determining protein MreD
MKKIVFYILFYNILYLFQFFSSRYFSICGVSPNFILIFIVYLGLSKGIVVVELIGFFLGLTWDAFSNEIFGMRAIMFTIIGYLVCRIYRNFDRKKFFTQFITIFFSGIVYWLGVSLFYFIFMNNRSKYITFFAIKSYFINIVFTVFICPVLFYIFDSIERFKNDLEKRK